MNDLMQIIFILSILSNLILATMVSYYRFWNKEAMKIIEKNKEK